MIVSAKVLVTDGNVNHIIEIMDSELGKKTFPVQCKTFELPEAVACIHLDWERQGNHLVACPEINMAKILEIREKILQTEKLIDDVQAPEESNERI